ncbi:hypothetical protein R1flu_015282 [Riccia fluitans]|uniref:Ribosomal protein S14 n=1 Tax=Riccia fluitans TaxID=41844 RepID=A0ABD1YII9_9MARC
MRETCGQLFKPVLLQKKKREAVKRRTASVGKASARLAYLVWDKGYCRGGVVACAQVDAFSTVMDLSRPVGLNPRLTRLSQNRRVTGIRVTGSQPRSSGPLRRPAWKLTSSSAY